MEAGSKLAKRDFLVLNKDREHDTVMDTFEHIVMSGDGMYPRTFANKHDARFKQVLVAARAGSETEFYLKTAIEYWLGERSKCILLADGRFEDLFHPGTYIDGEYDDGSLDVFKQAAWKFLGINNAPAVDEGVATFIFISRSREEVVNKLTSMAKKLSVRTRASILPRWIQALMLRM
jgi:hypothetical protein